MGNIPVALRRSAGNSMRNQSCPCGSGLKSKHCHQNPVYNEHIKMIAGTVMQMFIIDTHRKHDRLTDAEANGLLEQCWERIVSVLPECIDEEDAPTPEPEFQKRDPSEMREHAGVKIDTPMKGE